MAEVRVQRRLAAILAADVVGYSRLMEQDEAGTLAALKGRRREIVSPLVNEHNGRIIKVMGDGVLVPRTIAACPRSAASFSASASISATSSSKTTISMAMASTLRHG